MLTPSDPSPPSGASLVFTESVRGPASLLGLHQSTVVLVRVFRAR